MMANDYVIRIGYVVSIDDDEDAGRIKVRLHSDTRHTNTSKALDCFPLLPKVFQSIPKVGEAVIVINSKISDTDSNRWYVGPIISQPQNFYKDDYADATGIPNTGSATSALKSHGSSEPLKDGVLTKHRELTNGAFPGKDAQAIVGRKGEDVLVHDDEVMLRCGIRIKDQNGNVPGNVTLNRATPAIDFLKYAADGMVVSLSKPLPSSEEDAYNVTSINSLAGTRAEKIVLFSNEKANIYTQNGTSQFPEFMSKDEINELFKSLHQLPYGDKLVRFLDSFRKAYFSHEHSWAQEPVSVVGKKEQEDLQAFDLNTLVTNDIWIS